MKALANTTKHPPLASGPINTAQFQQQVYSLYAEYGLTKRLQATLNFPFFRRATFPKTSPGQGAGRILAAKHGGCGGGMVRRL